MDSKSGARFVGNLGLYCLAVLLLAASCMALEAQEVSTTVEYGHIGAFTDEPDRRVRAGSASGFDLAFGLHLSAPVTDDVDGYASLRLMPTWLCVWDREHDDIDPWHFRPQGCDHSFMWSALSFGARLDWVRAGLGVASISGASHDWWGAVPMHAPLVELAFTPSVQAGHWHLGPTCTAQYVLPNLVGDGYTVTERAAGIQPDEPNGGREIFVAYCGLRLGIGGR